MAAKCRSQLVAIKTPVTATKSSVLGGKASSRNLLLAAPQKSRARHPNAHRKGYCSHWIFMSLNNENTHCSEY